MKCNKLFSVKKKKKHVCRTGRDMCLAHEEIMNKLLKHIGMKI